MFAYTYFHILFSIWLGGWEGWNFRMRWWSQASQSVGVGPWLLGLIPFFLPTNARVGWKLLWGAPFILFHSTQEKRTAELYLDGGTEWIFGPSWIPRHQQIVRCTTCSTNFNSVCFPFHNLIQRMNEFNQIVKLRLTSLLWKNMCGAWYTRTCVHAFLRTFSSCCYKSTLFHNFSCKKTAIIYSEIWPYDNYFS